MLKHYNYFNLAFATDWEYDLDFYTILKQQLTDVHLTAYYINPNNINAVLELVSNDTIQFHALLDRASDTSPQFIELQNKLAHKGTKTIDTIDSINWASDKATMHLEFIANQLNTPFTIILPPYDSKEKCFLSLSDLYQLGRSFIIKPANISGGGIGIVNGAESLYDILRARQEFKAYKYLLQKKIIPQYIDNHRFWFRGFYCCGKIFCAWWNDITHEYDILTNEQIQNYELNQLFSIVMQIKKICKLNFFSTEITQTENREFIVIDYVNPSCDLRLKSKCNDGVPDSILTEMADAITQWLLNLEKSKQKSVHNS